MSEKYEPSEPSAEEMLQAENNMTKKQKEKSIDREATYKAGREHGHEEIINRIEGIKETLDVLIPPHMKKKLSPGIDLVDSSIRTKIEEDRYFEETKDFAINLGLSKKTEEALVRKEVTYDIETKQLSVNDVIDKEVLLELIDKLPAISKYYIGVRKRLFVDDDVIEKIQERFPEIEIDLPDWFID